MKSSARTFEARATERGHRIPTVLRKGGKIVTIPLAPRTARAIDLTVGERGEEPIFLRGRSQRMDRHAAYRIVHRAAKNGGLGAKRIRMLVSGCVDGVAALGSPDGPPRREP